MKVVVGIGSQRNNRHTLMEYARKQKTTTSPSLLIFEDLRNFDLLFLNPNVFVNRIALVNTGLQFGLTAERPAPDAEA